MRERAPYYQAGILLFAVLTMFAPESDAQDIEFRAFWVDVWGVGFKSTSDIDDMISRAVQGNYNAICPQVLAYHDHASNSHGAYWNSSIVPKAPDIIGGIDPLAYIVSQAHANGLEVHAWIVPYRVSLSWPPAGNIILGSHPEWLMTTLANMDGGPSLVDGAYTLDPGSPDVQEYVLSIVRELVSNYEIDGIHWDRARYAQTDTGYPAHSWYTRSGLARFQQITGYSGTPGTSEASWNDFRRREITELIRQTRVEIPSITSNPRQPIRHSAALITWGNAPYSFSQTEAWRLFQNWEEWTRLGFLDMAVVMTYYDHDTYPVYYTNWVNKQIVWSYDRHIVTGIGAYLNDVADSVTQITYALNAGADGICTYAYDATRNDGGSIWAWYPYVATEIFTQPALLPSMPWRDPATADEGTIWGQITDAATGQPLDDAAVEVSALDIIQTDGNGRYVVTMVSATAGGATYPITVSKTGFPGASHPGAIIFAGDVVRYDFELGSGPPTIEASITSIERSVIRNESLPDDTFTILNVGDGVLNYTISDDVTWLNVSPRQGTSHDEPDSCTIQYDITGLQFGDRVAHILIEDANATNPQIAITVTLHIIYDGIPGDFDDDEDVDQKDFGVMQTCLTGPAKGPPAPGCEGANLDGDNDVDQEDMVKFQACMTGPTIPGDPTCAD